MVAASACASGLPPTRKVRRSTPSRLSQGRHRNPGRGLTACRAVCRRQARRAGGRSLRRRRRQDAGAGRGDGKPRPDLRDRHRQAPAGADPRTHRARRRAQHPGPHAAGEATCWPISPAAPICVLIDAPCTGTGAWRRNPDAKWRVRPGALAERIKQQARCSTAPPRWSSRAAASPTSPARCWPRRTATRCGPLSAATPDFSVEKPAEVAQRAGRTRLSFHPRGAYLGAKVC